VEAPDQPETDQVCQRLAGVVENALSG
jgi:hypothetical protein